MKKVIFTVFTMIITVSLLFAADVKKDPDVDKKDDYLFTVDKKKQEDAKKSEKTAKQYIADLSSKDEDTIIVAADWLGKEKEKDAIPKLIEVLQNDKRIKVRIYAAIALGLIGEEKALEPLGNAVLNDSSPEVRYSALLAIHKIGLEPDTKIAQQKAQDFLKKVKESESDVYIKDYIQKMEEMYKEAAE